MGNRIATGMSDSWEDPERLVFYKEDIDRISRMLTQFLKDSNARCVLLVDRDGHLITRQGETGSYDMDTVSALVAGQYAATQLLAKSLKSHRYSILIDQGGGDSLQMTPFGQRTFLAVIFDERCSQENIRIHISRLARKLTQIFDEIAKRGRRGPDSPGETGPTVSPA